MLKLMMLWEQNPDLRLGQLMENLNKSGNPDLFYTEDTLFESWIDQKLDKSEKI